VRFSAFFLLVFGVSVPAPRVLCERRRVGLLSCFWTSLHVYLFTFQASASLRHALTRRSVKQKSAALSSHVSRLDEWKYAKGEQKKMENIYIYIYICVYINCSAS